MAFKILSKPLTMEEQKRVIIRKTNSKNEIPSPPLSLSHTLSHKGGKQKMLLTASSLKYLSGEMYYHTF